MLNETISQKKLLLNALRRIKRRKNGEPVWAEVAELCQVGATHAIEICQEIGINPYAFAVVMSTPE